MTSEGKKNSLKVVLAFDTSDVHSRFCLHVQTKHSLKKKTRLCCVLSTGWMTPTLTEERLIFLSAVMISNIAVCCQSLKGAQVCLFEDSHMDFTLREKACLFLLHRKLNPINKV